MTQRLPAILSLLVAFVCSLSACGGGGGRADASSNVAEGPPLTANELAVLIVDGDATSEAIARAYQLARGVPEANMIRVAVPTGSAVISAADFATLKATIDGRLPANVQATLVTWASPSRVLGSCAMGLTSALALGFDARYCGGCVVTATSPLYNSSSHRPWADHQVRPSMMLGASTLAEAQVLMARGVAADGVLARTGATGQAWLVRTSDANRSGRWDDFLALSRLSVPNLAMHYVDNADGRGSDLVTGQSNLLFYFTGLFNVPQAASNSWLPGAAADHLTSFGGVLPDGNGQMPITEWLRAGATASYGTVEEPCNYTNKFPRASVMVGRYQRGDTLIEAYWKSVQWPGQGLFVGEPLARPWAR
jgi:uncharacterized protein (TIGR03790 family)